MKWTPVRIMALWKAFPPAPEDQRLRSLRRWSMGLCMSASLTIALVDRIVAVHPALILFVAAVATVAISVTARYWIAKQRVDAAYQAALYDADQKARGGEGL